jgi:hypothetical protein
MAIAITTQLRLSLNMQPGRRQLIPEDQAGIRDLERDAVRDQIAIPLGIARDLQKHEPEDDQQQRREPDVAIVVRRRDPKMCVELRPEEEKNQTEKAVIDRSEIEEPTPPVALHAAPLRIVRRFSRKRRWRSRVASAS